MQCSCGVRLSIPAKLVAATVQCPKCGRVHQNPNVVVATPVRTPYVQHPTPTPTQIPQYQPASPTYDSTQSPSGGNSYWQQKAPAKRSSHRLTLWVCLVSFSVLILGSGAFVVFRIANSFFLDGNLPTNQQASAISELSVEESLSKLRQAGLATTVAELRDQFRKQQTFPDRTDDWARFTSGLQSVQLQDKTRFPSTDQFGRLGRVDRNQIDALIKLFVEFQYTIETCQRIADQPFGVRYTIPNDRKSWDVMSEIRRSEVVARLLVLDAYLRLYSGDSALATKRIIGCLNIARTIENYPNHLAQVRRYSIINDAKNALVTMLEQGKPDPHQLHGIKIQFQRIAQVDSSLPSFSGELAYGLAGYSDPEASLKYLYDVTADSKSDLTKWIESSKRYLEYDRGYFVKIMLQRVNAYKDYDQALLLQKREQSQNFGMAEMEKIRLAVLSSSPLDKINGFHFGIYHQANVGVSAIAVYQFMRDNNRLPNSLGELQPRYLGSLPRDVFGGGSLIYRQNSDGYELSSIAEANVGNDETWQILPPLQLRTRISTNTVNQTPPNYTMVPPGSSSNSDPNSVESIVREAERQAMENAAVSRRMQEEDEAKRKAGR